MTHNSIVSNKKVVSLGFYKKWIYSWSCAINDLLRQPLETLIIVIVISTPLTITSLCYIGWKNINADSPWRYPRFQLNAYLDKSLDDRSTLKVLKAIKAISSVEKINYLSREEALVEFRSWLGFGDALDMLEENPLPAVVSITLNANLKNQGLEAIKSLRDQVEEIQGVERVPMNNKMVSRMRVMFFLIREVSAIIGILMITTVCLIVINSVRLSILSRRNTIHVMRIIGATNGFILHMFLKIGALLSLFGALLSLIISKLIIWRIGLAVSHVSGIFSSTYLLHGLNFDEILLLLITATMVGWVTAWLATVQNLRQFKL